MAWSDSSRDSSDSAHSLSSGVFNAAGVQVKAMSGSSFVTDVIRVERLGVDSAVKILTPGATKDPELVSRFLTNARYNQGLNDFTGMKITEIVESGPRPYYVMEKVAEASLLEIIRQHSPIDARWLATLLLPIARMLDTIHQRSVLHANIKPSNILVTLENNQEKFLLVDYLEPSLAATSATLTASGVYAAPEFRAGIPVSNRSDIYSLAAVMYEGLSGCVPASAYRSSDGEFHVWRPGDQARDLNQINPEISRSTSEIIMNGIAPSAISRPATASALVEETLRTLEQPRPQVHVAAEPEVEHKPVPMLLIAAGVFLTILLIFGAYKAVSGVFGGSSPSTTTTASSSPIDTVSTAPSNALTTKESALTKLLPTGDQTCQPNRAKGNGKTWKLSVAALDCTATGTTSLEYGLFNNATDTDSTYKGEALTLSDAVVAAGGQVVVAQSKEVPCSLSPNESGAWGIQTVPGSPPSGKGGKFTCVSTPSPRIVWTDNQSGLIGDASLSNGTMSDLVTWWSTKGGPK